MSLAILKTNFRAAFDIIALIVMIGFILILGGSEKV